MYAVPAFAGLSVGRTFDVSPFHRRPITGDQVAVTLKRIPLATQLAVKALLDSGKTIKEVCKDSGLSTMTVWTIKHHKGLDPDRVDAIKKGLSGKFYSVADRSIDGITDEKIQKASVSQLIMTAGISVDKARLIEGQATARVEFRDATDDAIAREIEALEAQIASGPVVDAQLEEEASAHEADALPPATDGELPPQGDTQPPL